MQKKSIHNMLGKNQSKIDKDEKSDKGSNSSESSIETSESEQEGILGANDGLDSESSMDDDDFVREINENKAIKLQVLKLNERAEFT